MNCKPPSDAFRKSFEGASVQDIAIKGDRAAARFSNGEVVELVSVIDGWLIAKFDRKAGPRVLRIVETSARRRPSASPSRPIATARLWGGPPPDPSLWEGPHRP